LPFGHDYQIRLDQPLIAYSRAWAPCFAVRHVEHADLPLMAYVCASSPGVRIDTAKRTKSIDRAGLLKLLHHGPLQLPGKADHYAFVYEQPIAGPPPRRLWGAYTAKLLTANLIRPAIAALGDMFEADQAHGSIRPDNIFSMDSKHSLFTLGPATLCPPGYDQPSAYETIERALAKREAKGMPGPADDLFALGMTIYALAAGKPPGDDVNPDEAMQRRLRYSSQAALLDSAAIPRDLLDLIVGLTEDDIKMRWDLQKVSAWASGRKPEPVQRPNLGRRRITFNVGKQECDTAREVANALYANQPEGIRLVKEGTLDKWLVDNGAPPEASPPRTGEDDPVDDALNLTRAIVRCDPSGPIRYKSLSFYPAGAGSLLQQIINDPPRRQEFGEMLKGKIVSHWMRTAGAYGLVDMAAKRLQDVEKSFEQLGDQLESALYKLNPDAPCLSPAVAGKWASSHIDLATPIEKACEDENRPRLDRHMVGFFGARAAISDRAIAHWYKLDHPTKTAAPSVLRVAGRFQEDCDGKAFPNLAKVCLRMADTVLEDIHHPQTREKLREMLAQKAASGELTEMFDLAMDEDVRAADLRAFAEAKQEFDQLDAMLADREGLMMRSRRMGRDRGMEAAYGLLSIACMGGLIAMMFVELGAR
jgi:eukaryotic-like serine/threonine-protein kinase